MTDPTLDRVLIRCERFWERSGVPASVVAEMKIELASHLREALDAGKTAEQVVGPDVDTFAAEWAAAWRADERGAALPRVEPPRRELDAGGDNGGGWMIASTVGALAATVLLAVLGPKETSLDTVLWRWIWVGAAVGLGIGEMLTAGFFLLPFAVGAAAAAVLAFFEVSVVLQLILFAVISVWFLVILQRYARIDEENLAPVGANRYLDARATVLETIDRMAGTGRVRLETEMWRATTDRNEPIPPGTEVRVVEVRGARLVVEPLDT